MRRIAENPWAIVVAVLVAVFFAVALLYPLSYALVESVRDPVPATPQKGETLSAFAARVGQPEAQIRALNNIGANDTAAPQKPLTIRVEWTLRHILRIFHPDAPQWRWVLNSLALAGAVTLVCALISYPLAYLQARARFPFQNLLGGLLLLPLIMPPLVGAIGLRRMLAKYGSINLFLMDLGLVDPAQPIDFLDSYRFFGCVLVMTLHLYPLLYLNLATSIGNIDPSLLQSAANLGHSRWRIFRRVVLPLSTPGLIAGGSLVFVGAFTDLGTPLVFGYEQTAARQIYALANEQVQNPAAPALVAVVTAIVLALFLGTRWLLSRRNYFSGGTKGQTRVSDRPMSPAGNALAIGLHLFVIALAALPHFSVLLAAVGDRWFMTVLPPELTTLHLQEALSNETAIRGMRNSLVYASASTAIDVVFGLACAWAIVRGGGWWGRVIDGLSLAPLAVPGLVLAFGYVAAYAGIYTAPQIIGPFVVHFGVGTFLIMSYAIRRLPYTVRACAAGLEQTPVSLEEAGRGLGAQPWSVIRLVTLPLIYANIAAGAILAFSFAILEVSDSLILATRPVNFPLTKAIYSLFGNPGNGDQLASALGLVSLVFLTFSLLAAASFLGQKWGQMFRG